MREMGIAETIHHALPYPPMLARGRPQHDKRKESSVHPSLGTSEGTRWRTERRTGVVRGFFFKSGCGSEDKEDNEIR